STGPIPTRGGAPPRLRCHDVRPPEGRVDRHDRQHRRGGETSLPVHPRGYRSHLLRLSRASGDEGWSRVLSSDADPGPSGSATNRRRHRPETCRPPGCGLRSSHSPSLGSTDLCQCDTCDNVKHEERDEKSNEAGIRLADLEIALHELVRVSSQRSMPAPAQRDDSREERPVIVLVTVYAVPPGAALPAAALEVNP